MPAGPAGIPKFKMTFSDVPLFVTVAWLPAGKVVVLPMLTVAAPGSPSGITKFKMAFVAVPELVTLAWVPGAPVGAIKLVHTLL